MSIQVNIFEAGSVPTAQELVTLINELNTSLDESVTLTGEQSITGVKTFLGSKLLKFKQSVSADKLGFTLYDYQSKEVGNFEYDNKNNFRLLALGNYVSAANQEVECNIGFKIYNKLQGAAYRLLCPLAGNAKNSIPSLSETYTNFYMPLVFTNGAVFATADNNGKVDLSALIGSGGGSGDVSGLATVATTGNYNDLLNKPILFSGNYNDLNNKPTLFSGSYGDLTDKPTLFSGDYNDLTNKPIIPVVDITKAQADGWYQPIGDYALTTDLFSGSYNDLTDKPSLFSGNYNDLTNKPSLFSGSYNDLTDKPTLFSGSYNDLSDKPTIPTNLSDLSDDSTHRLVTDTEKTTWNNKSDFSGSYNDLTDKPTIPTVPTISTNITSDATSDTKTASPKAVKDFVEGKGYLTQHQDISGKADQTDLEALEDRVETLEQSGSGGGSSITIDSALDKNSNNPVRNKALYDGLVFFDEEKLRVELSTNGTSYSKSVYGIYDANSFPKTTINGILVYIIPGNYPSYIKNSTNKTFALKSSSTPPTCFDSSSVRFLADAEGNTNNLYANVVEDGWAILAGTTDPISIDDADLNQIGISNIYPITLIPVTYESRPFIKSYLSVKKALESLTKIRKYSANGVTIIKVAGIVSMWANLTNGTYEFPTEFSPYSDMYYPNGTRLRGGATTTLILNETPDSVGTSHFYTTYFSRDFGDVDNIITNLYENN